MSLPSCFANFGPRDRPILGTDEPPALGVYPNAEGLGMPIGVAYPVGLTEHRRGPAKTFRLVVGGVELEGLWLCDRRVFVQLGDGAEVLD